MAKLKQGRPTALTPQVQKEICGTIEKAGTLEDAALIAGVSEATLHRWMAQGEAESEGPFRAFRDAVRRARSLRRVKLEQSIALAGKKSWQAMAWLLERTEPKRYALRVSVQVHEELSDAIERLKEAFRDDPEGLERALSAITGGDRSEGAEPSARGEGGPDDSGDEAVHAPPSGLEATGLPIPGR